MVDFGRYKWNQSQTLDDVLAFSLFLEGVDTMWCANKDAFFQMRFKALRGNSKGKVQRGQYLLAVDLGRYKMVSEPDTGRCVRLLAVPRMGRHEAVC